MTIVVNPECVRSVVLSVCGMSRQQYFFDTTAASRQHFSQRFFADRGYMKRKASGERHW